MTLYLDTETYNEVGINAGAWRYHETSEVIVVTYAIDDGPVQGWLPQKERAPRRFTWAWQTHDIVVHNIGFDYPAMQRVMTSMPPLEQWYCTMAQAYLHGLPGSLGLLCDLYKLDQDTAKMKEGKDLVRLFCTPHKNAKIQRATQQTHPQEWERFIQYAKQDVAAMRELHKRMPKWNLTPTEREFFLADFDVNMRGVNVDVELAQRVVETVEAEKESLAAATQAMTEGAVGAATQRDKLLQYIAASYGIELPDMRAATLEALVASEDTPSTLRALLQVRLDSSTSSVAKYKTLLRCVSSDGRLRGLEQYRGAARTGRQAHRAFQPGNLPRPQVPKKEIPFGIEAFKSGAADILVPNVMAMAASCIRGCIIPSGGKHLLVGDWANIEGRVAAWRAGEEWKIKAFQAYDAGEGPDLYVLAFAKAFGFPIEEVDDWGRSVGKVMELFLQYGGGVGAFVTGATTYRIDLGDMASRALPLIPEDVLEEAERMYEWWTVQMKKSDYGLDRTTFVVCDALKRLWRRRHPMIVSRWSKLEEGFIASIVGGEMPSYISRKSNWTRLQLPSGRYLSYPNMRLGRDTRDGKTDEAKADDAEVKYSLVFDGVNGKTKKWGKIYTHGGVLFENETQATAADILNLAKSRANRHNFYPVMDVHDEIVLDTDRDEEQLKELMETGATWLDGLPLRAEVFKADRYRKD